jgi:hypothetical protein
MCFNIGKLLDLFGDGGWMGRNGIQDTSRGDEQAK